MTAQATGGPDAADRLTELLIRYRWLLVVPVLLPLSTLFNLLWAIRGLYVHRLRRAPERHDKRVIDVQGADPPVAGVRRPGTALYVAQELDERLRAHGRLQAA